MAICSLVYALGNIKYLLKQVFGFAFFESLQIYGLWLKKNKTTFVILVQIEYASNCPSEYFKEIKSCLFCMEYTASPLASSQVTLSVTSSTAS